MKNDNKSSAVRKWIIDIAVIIAAAAIYSLGVNCFISPNNITVGFDDVGSLENVKAKLRVRLAPSSEP